MDGVYSPIRTNRSARKIAHREFKDPLYAPFTPSIVCEPRFNRAFALAGTATTTFTVVGPYDDHLTVVAPEA